nr:hypothetical protein [Tanacetum cinerariifolium]
MPCRTGPDRRPTRTGPTGTEPYHFGPVLGLEFWTNSVSVSVWSSLGRAMVLMVERNRGEHLIRRFARRGNEPDPRDVKIASLKQQIQELEFPQLQQDSLTEEAKTESNETESEPIIWDIGDEEDEYPFVNKYSSFQEEHIVLVEKESCPVYDTDNEDEELILVYDTDIENVIEEEEGFVRK